MRQLDGKVALVTGGSRGMGAAITARLAQEGADVALTYRKSEHRAREVVDQIKAAGRRGLSVRADNADPHAVAGAVDRTFAEFGRLDILVNNAGIFPYGAFDDVTLDELDETLAIHTKAVFVATQAAVKRMTAGGAVITVGSSLAERIPYPGITLYAMSKSALIGFTKGLARDIGERQITANLVQPGSTDTEMNPADGEGADDERAQTALGRYGNVDDISGMVAYLAGAGGRNITGSVITIDGGANA